MERMNAVPSISTSLSNRQRRVPSRPLFSKRATIPSFAADPILQVRTLDIIELANSRKCKAALTTPFAGICWTSLMSLTRRRIQNDPSVRTWRIGSAANEGIVALFKSGLALTRISQFDNVRDSFPACALGDALLQLLKESCFILSEKG
jgi:hypothetical protein